MLKLISQCVNMHRADSLQLICDKVTCFKNFNKIMENNVFGTKDEFTSRCFIFASWGSLFTSLTFDGSVLPFPARDCSKSFDCKIFALTIEATIWTSGYSKRTWWSHALIQKMKFKWREIWNGRCRQIEIEVPGKRRIKINSIFLFWNF